jgi:hypothetical protein
MNSELKLPPYLRKALIHVLHGGGEDLGYALGYLNRQSASSYVSKLKSLGLAYTYRNAEGLEVWATEKGSLWVQANVSEDELNGVNDLD